LQKVLKPPLDKLISESLNYAKRVR